MEPRPFSFDDAFLRQLERLALRARRRSTESRSGDRPSRRVGLGVDFADHRAYTPGDDPRALDWNVLARSDRLVTRQFEATDELGLTLLVDTSASMRLGAPEKSLFARKVAAAVGYVGLVRAGTVSAHGFARALQEGPLALRGRGQAQTLFGYLAGLKSDGETDLPAAARALASHPWHRRHRGLVLVLSDFAAAEAATTQALTFLRQQGFEPVVAALSAPEERTPALALGAGDRHPSAGNVQLTLVDPETQARVELPFDEALFTWWRARHGAFVENLLRQARRAGMGAVALDTALAAERAALETLREAGLIH